MFYAQLTSTAISRRYQDTVQKWDTVMGYPIGGVGRGWWGGEGLMGWGGIGGVGRG